MKIYKAVLFFLGILVLFTWGFTQTAQDFVEYNQKAEEALRKNEYKTALGYFQQMLRIIPDHPRLHYHIARMLAFLAENKKAINSLNRALDLGYAGNAETDKAFEPLLEILEFQPILKKIIEIKKPIHKSHKVFTIGERDLVPEGIAYDPVDDCFYLGSTYKCKIVKVDKNSNKVDFTSEKQDGLRTVLGMKVDAKQRILWANSAVGDPPPQEVNPEEVGWSGLFKYDLKTENLIKKYTIYRKGERHLFNDLVFNSKGDVFITDSDFGAIYTVSYKKNKLELLIKSNSFIYPNGITISPDEKTLYVAHSGGIIALDPHTKKYTQISHSEKMSLTGIDGLYFYKNSFIAVQNRLDRISRFFFNQKLDYVENMEILESNNPLLDIPTTGVVVNNQFYYIANCALRAFKPDGTLDRKKLKDVIILKTDLENRKKTKQESRDNHGKKGTK